MAAIKKGWILVLVKPNGEECMTVLKLEGYDIDKQLGRISFCEELGKLLDKNGAR